MWGDHSVALYSICWWNWARILGGDPGNRNSRIFRFIDPEQFDLNHVVGFRDLTQPAFIYHFAGTLIKLNLSFLTVFKIENAT